MKSAGFVETCSPKFLHLDSKNRKKLGGGGGERGSSGNLLENQFRKSSFKKKESGGGGGELGGVGGAGLVKTYLHLLCGQPCCHVKPVCQVPCSSIKLPRYKVTSLKHEI